MLLHINLNFSLENPVQPWLFSLVEKSRFFKSNSNFFINILICQREVLLLLTSVAPKYNNGLMTHYYIWVRAVSVIPKRNNGSMTHCYIWVRWTTVIPKRNNGSIISCYDWVIVRLSTIFTFGYDWCRLYRNYMLEFPYHEDWVWLRTYYTI